ncbi:MAG: CoA-transferase [Syntrophales bacterium]|nr:CoA-transferase [Syntrophales bacterium]
MKENVRRVLEKNFQIKEYEGTDKVCDLGEAIRENVKPGMTIHTCQTGARWCTAAIYELARQFWGKTPAFTVVGISLNHPISVLVHGGLVKKLITSYCGDPYYTPGPNGAFQRAYKEKTTEIEIWSILTVPLRLKAAAMGVAFMPTRSLIGSSMEEENREDFIVMDDPFGSGEKVGLLRALYPDISITHGWAADRYGNTLLLPPYADNMYGCMASRNGTIVTVEKIVSTDYIRQHSHLMKLPGDYVTAVCEVPFGAHPSGLSNRGISDFPAYCEDYDFVDAVCKAAKDPEEFDRWINKWVLGCRDHAEYTEKLGYERILTLKGRVQPDSWRYDAEALAKEYDAPEYTPLEMAVVVAGRKTREVISKNDYRTILAGAGVANLAAWLAYFALKEKDFDIELMAEIGLYGYSPTPFDPAVFNHRNFPTCKALADIHDVMGIFLSGSKNRCIGTLGVAEIDKYGNINTTKIPEKRSFIVGSGGANDIASSAREILTIAVQAKGRFLDKVSYITSPGKVVKTLVSTLGIFEKLGEDQEFTLTGYFRNPQFNTSEEHIRHIGENCGWEVKVSANPEEIPPPTLEELILLRMFDPRRYYLG